MTDDRETKTATTTSFDVLKQVAISRLTLSSIEQLYHHPGFALERASAMVHYRLTAAFEDLRQQLDETEAAMLGAVVEQTELRPFVAQSALNR